MQPTTSSHAGARKDWSRGFCAYVYWLAGWLVGLGGRCSSERIWIFVQPPCTNGIELRACALLVTDPRELTFKGVGRTLG